MKKLTIIRHAKAVEAAPALTDFERPLTKRGLKDAERIGGCTYGSPEQYFSHRYATHQGGTTGRQIAVIGLV